MLLTFLTLLTLNINALTLKGSALIDAPSVFKQIEEEFSTCSESISFDYMPKYLYPSSTLAQTHDLGDEFLIELTPQFKKMNPKLQYILIVHELGHVKGLEHSDDEKDIMYPALKLDVNLKNYKVDCFNATK